MASKANILVVDDDPDIRDTLRIVLEKAGYAVRLASNGKQALERLREERPDMVILDVMMSHDTEGFDLAFELKGKPEYQGMPIVMLTSFLEKVRADGPDQFQHILGEEWPAKWLFEKPADPKKLLAKIESILRGE